MNARWVTLVADFRSSGKNLLLLWDWTSVWRTDAYFWVNRKTLFTFKLNTLSNAASGYVSIASPQSTPQHLLHHSNNNTLGNSLAPALLIRMCTSAANQRSATAIKKNDYQTKTLLPLWHLLHKRLNVRGLWQVSCDTDTMSYTSMKYKSGEAIISHEQQSEKPRLESDCWASLQAFALRLLASWLYASRP
jgi:hypothetical protein